MRDIVTTTHFERELVAFARKHPEYKELVRSIMQGIASGSIRSHALHGQMKGTFSARISQLYRLIFVLTPDTATFIDIGSHDEVY